MKQILALYALLVTLSITSQNIVVDSQTYTPQQLIENILIDSDCITNVIVTNVVGGNFNNADQSYGFFDATGTTFPFQSGVVLSTGRLANVEGPNNTLSDDNATDWVGDLDLEDALNETGTINATILEFDFTSVATQVSFRYIFASEEYQENNSNSCLFSDVFGFLIRPAVGQNQYENIALVPDTNIPVKATTVTPGVPGSCPPENETYFGSYNGANAPVNFNGQTAILTATANVIPNQTYHVKLVIADEQNFRYDSAVFLEAGSFQLSSDLGPNRLLATGNALCEGGTLNLNVNEAGSPPYNWFRNGVLVQSTPAGCINCGNYLVTEPGTYTVEVELNNTCISYGEVVIEYAQIPVGENSTLVECDSNLDGLTTYNLFDAENDLLSSDTSAAITSFFLTEADALANSNAIPNTTSFNNTIPSQTVYARLINPANCSAVAELELQTSNNTVTIPDLGGCDGEIIDGFATFILSDIEESVLSQIPTNSQFTYYETEADALAETNALSNTFINTSINSQTIFVRINSNTNSQCFGIATANLVVLSSPILEEDVSVFYCLNSFPETLTLLGGVVNDLPNNYFYQWFLDGTFTNVTTSFYDINETGNYTVVVTAPNGCSSSRMINVVPSETAIIEAINSEGVSPNHTINVSVSGSGFYEYALDDSNGFYQESNSFTNVSQGLHTIYVKDRNGCGIVEETISVLGFPKFFTPNGDNQNDTWRVIGTSTQFNQIQNIQIFNRYGKLITVQTVLSLGWDGTFNGNRLPSDDYWYIAKFLDGKTYTGHFTLRR
ncbi:choice-of-anchor L domain-containing protein [uncultured Winogradskyella sp.]|uniref:choice-of-anchor L domain-containing protein n=1 Tax=uncultured Winogradskyella sp. TaxID=395353 RepID=UPI0030DA63D4|tara:strand:- start:110286 stop:112640 length:2355 start_codon:yes stop_codon:yes gene_type:complete